MAFSQVQTLVGDLEMDNGVNLMSCGTDGSHFYYFTSSIPPDLYEYDPVTNTETLIIQESDLTAIRADSSAPGIMHSSSIANGSPLSFGGGDHIYFPSKTATGLLIWRWSNGSLSLDHEIVIGASRVVGSMIFAAPYGSLVVEMAHRASAGTEYIYETQFKSSDTGGWRVAPTVAGYPDEVLIGTFGKNSDIQLPSPYYARVAGRAGGPYAGEVLLLRWSGSSWQITDSTYSGDPIVLFGPSHYWTDWPLTIITQSKGTWTDDFVTFTAVGGSQDVFGGRMVNMPFEVGVSGATNYYRYNSSSNDWTLFDTGPAHQPGSNEPFIMWQPDAGDIYLFYTPLANDWRVAKKIYPPSRLWGGESPANLSGLHTAFADFSNLRTEHALNQVRELNQFGATPYQRNFQVSAIDASIYLGNQIGADNQQVGRLQPPYTGTSSSLDADEDLTDSISSDDVYGVDLTDAI